ncbi:MAG: LOG family protein [Desulfosarcinaceae bacterium]
MISRRDDRSFRGLLQSDDGVISRVLSSNDDSVVFEASFGLSANLIERLKSQPEHILFSERSRIARLGVQITCPPVSADQLERHLLTVPLTATAVISAYPGLAPLRAFFDVGLPVGRLVFCDPEALLSAEEVLAAIEASALKLPASTAISSDGQIVISPHKVVYDLSEDLDENAFGRILLRSDGRELLNRYQIERAVPAVRIDPGEGVITTCSMYLNEHYVVLQSGSALGRNLPATVLDPIKTRGIRIYLEIVNGSGQPIVNPLIAAKVYGMPQYKQADRRRPAPTPNGPFDYHQMRTFEKKLVCPEPSTCPSLEKPAAVFPHAPGGLAKAKVFANGPDELCKVPPADCLAARRVFSPRSKCAHRYATAYLEKALSTGPGQTTGGKNGLALKFFPNLMEHRDIINLACEGIIDSLYFFEPSWEHGPFLSQQDHHRLQEYDTFGLRVYWVCSLTDQLMVHTMRDGKGYFVLPDRLADFHKSMLFAFYGSNRELSTAGVRRLGALMDALIAFWGANIGIVTGGGSGVMERANALARDRGILSGANFLDITDQSMTTDVDFCQVFQSTCRHSRQKWFEIASFPIFNVGGLGSLEELGITLCNMKLSIMERVPLILFDTEGDANFWAEMKAQLATMVRFGRAPAWVLDNVVITADPEEIVAAYRQRLQLF